MLDCFYKEMTMLRVHTKNFGSIVILCVQGRIVIGETKALRDAVLSQSGIGLLVLDLARVDTIDAAGFGALLALRAETRSKGISLKLMNVTKNVRQLLDITRLSSVFEVTSMLEVMPEGSFLSSSIAGKFAACA
jgi:anti-sigma B factor antagonist